MKLRVIRIRQLPATITPDMDFSRLGGAVAPYLAHLLDPVSMVPGAAMFGAQDREERIQPTVNQRKILAQFTTAVCAMLFK